MRHRKQGRGLSRSPSHRKAMLSNLATSVLDAERVRTTTAKAKEVRRLVERLITFGKRQDLHARRQALRIIRNESVVAKLFGPLAERYADRPGGYTRIVRVGHRQGDAADMSILELIDRDGAAEEQVAETADEKKEAEAEQEEQEEQAEDEKTG